MPKQKKIKTTDQEALKHYTANESIPDAGDQPHAKKILEDMRSSNPKMIIPQIAIDHTLAKRKSAVIKLSPPDEKKKKR